MKLSWQENSFTDTHCHISHLSALEWSLARERAESADVRNLIFITTHLKAIEDTRALLSKEDQAWMTLGTHPHEAKDYDFVVWEKMFQTQNYLAVGECGLDYYYDHSPRDIQQKVFEHQLLMAQQYHKPVVAHVRDAFEDVLPMISRVAKQGVKGVVHCFTGNLAQAKAVLDCGWYLGFTGIVTFGKRAEALLEVVDFVPMNRILLETDSPYLAPHPYRGKPNEPCYLPFIAQTVAARKKLAIEEIRHQTTKNAMKLFC